MGALPWLFVHEYVTGGGLSSRELPGELAAEGAAMLRAVLADCAAWGGVRTLSTLDWRLADVELPAEHIIRVVPGGHAPAFRAALARCDAALVIAPETAGLLAELNGRVLEAGACLVGSAPEAVRLAGDKWACYQRWLAAGVPTPLTSLADPGTAVPAAQDLGYPVVVKPVDGVGCEGVSLARDDRELGLALALIDLIEPRPRILLQRYLPGKPASVSLMVAGDRVLPLSLNSQDIRVGRPFSYRGGAVPLAHPLRDEALAVAVAAAGAVPGLQGYVGVDLVLDDSQAWAVELNPRLTTAYVGLRRVAGINLARAIWEACTQGALPASVALAGQASFGKDRPGGLWEAGWQR